MTISQCYATGSVTQNLLTESTSELWGSYIGGLTGGIISVTIQRSFATGDVFSGGYAYYFPHAGGLSGYSSSSTINDSYSLGSVTTNGSSAGGFGAVGGFVGQSVGSVFNRDYSGAFTLSGNTTNNVGGYIGIANGIASSWSGNYFYDGPNVPSQSISGVTSYTTTIQMQTQSNFTSFSFPTIWRMPTANPLSPNGLLSPVLNWQCGSNGITCQ